MNEAGVQSSPNLQWKGVMFDVNEVQPFYWSQAELYQLSVILASFADWPEVAALGARYAGGGRTLRACAAKAHIVARTWDIDQDECVRRLSSPDP